MFETIVVGIDGSESARAALDAAVALGQQSDATVHVVAVVRATPGQYSFSVTEVDELNRAADELVDEMVDTYEGEIVDLVGTVRRGKPAETLLSYVDDVEGDLLVVGKRGADTLERILLGSTADRLAHLTETPLWIVPADEPVWTGDGAVTQRLSESRGLQ